MKSQPLTSTTPDIPPQPVEQKPSHSNRTFKIILVVFLFLFLAAVIMYAFQNYQPQQETKVIPPTEPTTTPSPTPLPDLSNRVTDSGTKSGLKTFTGDFYSISFPPDWKFKGPIISDNGFIQAISITSPTNTTSLQVGLNYDFPHDFGPEAAEHTLRKVQAKIGSKTYEGEETTYGNKTSVYTMVTAPDLIVKYNSIYNDPDELPMFFMYGNDYPLQEVRSLDKLNSAENYQQYLKDKKIIDQILSSFRFLPQDISSNPLCGKDLIKVLETYKNDNYGFSIEYPKGWIIDSPAYGGKYMGGPARDEDKYYVLGVACTEPQGDWTMVITAIDSSFADLEKTADFQDRFKSKEIVQVNNQSAIKVLHDNNTISYYFEKPDKSLVINMGGPFNDSPEKPYNENAKNILSTFKFL